jgi:hypothetical protein
MRMNPHTLATDRNTSEGVVSSPQVAPRSWLQLNTPITDWHGRRVWLVGASTGIGLACAQALRAAGAQVVVVGGDFAWGQPKLRSTASGCFFLSPPEFKAELPREWQAHCVHLG